MLEKFESLLTEALAIFAQDRDFELTRKDRKPS